MAADVVINEILASNSNAVQDEDGDNSDYLELYNRGDSTAYLGGMYLTDNDSNLTKWQLPAVELEAGEYLVIFASSKNRAVVGSELHTNFNLSADGEYLALVETNGTTIVSELSPGFPSQFSDISYGLADVYEDEVFVGQELRFFTLPTPGAENGEGVIGFVDNVEVSQAHGFFDDEFLLTLQTPTSGAQIYYTFDGSVPGPDNPLSHAYVAPILIDTTTIIRTAAYLEDYGRSQVNTQTYIFLEDTIHQLIDPQGENPFGITYPTHWDGDRVGDYSMDPAVVAAWDDANPNNNDYGIREALRAMPSMSLVMDHDDLWDRETGIYPNAEERADEWRRPASIEYFDPTNGDGFQHNVGVEMSGGGSRTPNQPKHNFRLIFNPEFEGPGRLDFPLYDHSNFADINSVVLKGMNQDAFSVRAILDKFSPLTATYVRDQWMLDSYRDMGQLASEYTYVHLYINGLYWGLFETVERIDDASLASRLGGEPEDWDVIRPNNEFTGSDAAWNAMFDLAGQANAGNASSIYYQLQGLNPDGTRNPEFPVYLDMENLIDYMILHYYSGAQEWGTVNWVAARNRVDPGSGFKFFVWDQDVVLDGIYNQKVNNTGAGVSSCFRLRWLLRHSPEFQLQFADRVQMHLFNGGTLTNEQAAERWQGLADHIEPAMVAESARWGDTRAGQSVVLKTGNPPVILPTVTIDHWRDSVEAVHGYLPESHTRLIGHLRSVQLFSLLDAPLLSKFGGAISSDYELTLSKPSGTPASAKIYYTLNGSDPRLIGGGLSSAAIEYTGPFTLDTSTQIRTRMLDGSTWSAIVDTAFNVIEPDPYPGDYDDNFVVNHLDYQVWKGNFGNTVQPGTGADGNGDGIVDAADYTVWQDNLGQTYTPAADFSFNHIGQTYSQNFDSFRGTQATIPAHFTVAVAGGTNIYRGVFNSTSSSASSFTGIMATTADDQNHSFSWRESTGPAGLDDTRVLFTFTNNTGEAITGFNVSYDVETWVNGRRDNQLRFKYDVYPDSAAAQVAEGRNAFETDIFATDNPNHTPIAANGDQFVRNGKNSANRETVSGFVDLALMLKDESSPQLGYFGALQPGETAYFRWQISNGDLEEGNRSALGFDNLTITPVGQAPGGGGLAAIAEDATSDPVDLVLDATLAPANHVIVVAAEYSTVTTANSHRPGSNLARSAANPISIAEAHAELLLIARSHAQLSRLEAGLEREYTIDSAFDDFSAANAPDGLLSELVLDRVGQAIA